MPMGLPYLGKCFWHDGKVLWFHFIEFGVLGGRVSCSPALPENLVLLIPPPDWCGDRHAPPCLASSVVHVCLCIVCVYYDRGIHGKIRGQFVGVLSFLLPYGFWELDSGCLSWWGALLLTEPSWPRPQ